jgi:uncharacterized protein (DUF1810 family)
MPATDDPFGLSRFVAAQDGAYPQALNELRRGRKTGHWMWFVFPQIAGLGRSSMAQLYAISSLDEARAYLRHPVLGPRLIECASAVATHARESATRILGDIDAIKLRSCMTLFQHADPSEPVFGRVLELFFDGEPDAETLRRL